MKKMMLGLAAVSLLASCGLIKTPPITLQDTTKTVTAGSNIGGGALGIDGKGAPLSLVNKALMLQGVNTNVPIASGTFDNVTSTDLVNNISRLSEWGATQTMPLASLSGTNCPATFSATNVSFTATITDTLNQTPRTASGSVSFPSIVFTATAANPCDYNVTINGAVAAIGIALSGTQLQTLAQILTTGSNNTATLTGTYTVPNTVEQRTLTIKFGGSSSYVIATVI